MKCLGRCISLRSILRATGWLAFVALLGGLGWALYEFLPPRPRWVVDGESAPWTSLPDGKEFLLRKGIPDPTKPESKFEAVVRDLATGEARWPFDRDLDLDFPELSPDRKWLISNVRTRTEVICADLETGSKWRAEMPALRFIQFAPDSSLILFLGETAWICETATGQVLDRTPAEFSASPKVLGFTPTHVVTWAREDSRKSKMRLWNRQTKAASVVDVQGRPLALSPDGNFLVLQEGDEKQVGSPQAMVVWDFPALAHANTICRFPLRPLTGDEYVVFAPDSKSLAIHIMDMKKDGDSRTMHFWDLSAQRPAGRIEGAGPYRVQNRVQQMYSDDGRLWIQNDVNKAKVSAFDASTGRQLWEEASPGFLLSLAADGRRLVFLSSDAKRDDFEIRDTASGALLLALRADAPPNWNPHIRLSENDRYLTCAHALAPEEPGAVEKFLRSWLPASWFSQTRRRVSLVDVEAAVVIAQQELPCAQVWVSEDGRSLITRSEPDGSGERTISCWDVPFNRYWLAIVGVPGGIGFAAVAWRWSRQAIK